MSGIGIIAAYNGHFVGPRDKIPLLLLVQRNDTVNRHLVHGFASLFGIVRDSGKKPLDFGVMSKANHQWSMGT